jgi:hypothetical protein
MLNPLPVTQVQLTRCDKLTVPIDLFKIDKPMVFDLYAYDAGTEQNTEKKEDLPALGGLGRPEEKLPIRRHTGIRGDADAPADWGWEVAKPAARMTVTPK